MWFGGKGEGFGVGVINGWEGDVGSCLGGRKLVSLRVSEGLG